MSLIIAAKYLIMIHAPMDGIHHVNAAACGISRITSWSKEVEAIRQSNFLNIGYSAGGGLRNARPAKNAEGAAKMIAYHFDG